MVRYSAGHSTCTCHTTNPDFLHCQICTPYCVECNPLLQALSSPAVLQRYLTEVLQELLRDLHQQMAAVSASQYHKDSQHPKDGLGGGGGGGVGRSTAQLLRAVRWTGVVVMWLLCSCYVVTM